jgi:hypothetical protein
VASFKIGRSDDLPIKFFLYIMEQMISHEFQINGKHHLQNLLQNDSFVKACAVLALQVNGFINDDNRVTLKGLLTFFKLSAIDLWKVLVSFCRGNSLKIHVPTVLLVHLYELEVTILLCLMWTKGSLIFRYIQNSKEQLAAEGQEQSDPDFSDCRESDEDNSKIEEESQDNKQPQASLSFEILLKRLLSVIAERLHMLCFRLNLEADMMENIWKLVKKMLIEETDILQDSHLDCIIICSVYAVCKKSKTSSKKLKDIIEE